MRIPLYGRAAAWGMVILLWMASSATLAQTSPEEEARRYFLRGIAAVEMAKSNEELANAVEEFRKATQIAPTMAVAWYNLGMVQSKIGRLKDAIDSFGRYVALAPPGEEVQKVRDEMVKLEYRLEQSEKFKHLSGVWIMPNGTLAQARVEGTRMTIHIAQMSFPGTIERWMWSDRVEGDSIGIGGVVLQLEIKGDRLAGVMEIDIPPSPSSGSSPHQWCELPAGKSTSQADGTLVDGAMLLKVKRTKYRFEHNKGESVLFGSSKVRCDAVTPLGEVVVETKLRGPQPPLARGGVGAQLNSGRYVENVTNPASGLLSGDEIISVDGVVLAELGSTYERMLRLRGEPGSVAHLVVRRVLEKAGTFSKEKSALLDLTVQRIEIKSP